jgi:hypothetical protein
MTTNAATLLVLSRSFELEGYLLLLLPLFLIPCLIISLAIGKLVRWLQRDWAAPVRSLESIAVFLSTTSLFSLLVTTLPPAWAVQGNGPIVAAVALMVCALSTAAHARYGHGSRWILLASGGLLACTAVWIEMDRWWMSAVFAGHEGGISAFFEHAVWAWPPQRITIVVAAAGVLAFFHWVVGSGLPMAPAPLVDPEPESPLSRQ